MVDIAFLTQPSTDEVNQIYRLYCEAGWWTSGVADPALIRRIISGSHCFVIAVNPDGIIGMGRAISDGASDAYIQDVTVLDGQRGKGIGKKIVQKLVLRLESDGLTWIGLIAERGSQNFYKPLGFESMPDARPMLLERS